MQVCEEINNSPDFLLKEPRFHSIILVAFSRILKAKGEFDKLRKLQNHANLRCLYYTIINRAIITVHFFPTTNQRLFIEH